MAALSIAIVVLAILAFIVQFIYKSIGGYNAFFVPKSLQQLPRISAWQSIKNMTNNVRFEDLVKQQPEIAANNSAWVWYTRGKWTLMLNNPAYVKPFLVNSRTFAKYTMFAKTADRDKVPLINRYMGPQNIVNSAGDEWWKRRKVAYPVFNSVTAWDSTTIFGRLTNLVLNTFPAKVDDLNAILSKFTFDVLGEVALGYDFHTIDDPTSPWLDKYNAAMRGVVSARLIDFALPWLAPFFPRHKTRAVIDEIRNLAAGQIAERRVMIANGSMGEKRAKDVLDLLLEANEGNRKDGTVLSDDDILDDLMVYILAGHDTTSSALTTAMYYMAKFPSVQKRARQEVLTVIPNAKDRGIPTMEQVNNLHYIDMIIRENLRVHPPADVLTQRVCTEDTVLEGNEVPPLHPNGMATGPGPLFIPKGTLVSTSIYMYHHNKLIWGDDAFEFKPERWEAISREKVSFDWIPFSQGPRICLGYKMSLLEQRTFLAMTLSRFEWGLPKDSVHNNGLKLQGQGSLLPGAVEPVSMIFKELAY